MADTKISALPAVVAEADADEFACNQAGTTKKETRAQIVSTVTGNLATHAALNVTGTHGSTTAATVNRIVHRDAAGRAKVVAPAVATDVALQSTVTADIATHQAIGLAHSPVSAPTPNTLMRRDGGGRSAVVAPLVFDDIARLDTVTTHIATHAALTTAVAHANRTRKFFVPVIGGINVTDAGAAITVSDVFGIELPLNKLAGGFGFSLVPEDFASGMTATAVVVPAPTNDGNVYGQNSARFGACGELNNLNSDIVVWAAVAVTVNENNCIMANALTGEATGDILRLSYYRDATNILDTVNGSVFVTGWILEYLADS